MTSCYQFLPRTILRRLRQLLPHTELSAKSNSIKSDYIQLRTVHTLSLNNKFHLFELRDGKKKTNHLSMQVAIRWGHDMNQYCQNLVPLQRATHVLICYKLKTVFSSCKNNKNTSKHVILQQNLIIKSIPTSPLPLGTMDPPGTTTSCWLGRLSKLLPDEILTGVDLVLQELFVQLCRV